MNEPTHRLSNIDVLRGAAAFSVCIFHFSRNHFLGVGGVEQIAQEGYLGVDAFFVISGFVIPLALWKAQFNPSQFAHFLFARLLRLYPAFLAAAVSTILLWYGSSLAPGFKGSAPHFTLHGLITNATLTCDVFGDEWLVPVFWTLAIEAQYYIVIALTFPLIVSPKPVVRFATLASWMGVPLVCSWKAALFPYCGLFVLGILVFSQSFGFLSKKSGAAFAAFALGVQCLSGGFASAIVGGCSYCFILYTPEIKIAPLIALGSVSYSLYLLHVPIGGRVINLSARWGASMGCKITAFCVALSFSLLAASVLFTWIEKPAHTLSRGWWVKRPNQYLKATAQAKTAAIGGVSER